MIRRLGVIAGAGMLPRALVQKCSAQGIEVAVVALRGFASPDDFSTTLRTELSIGQGKRIIRFFRDHAITDLVMIGAVTRPSLWDVRPDFWTLTRVAPAILGGGLGDDGLLKFVRRIFEDQGFTLHPIQSFLPDLIAGAGALGKMMPDESAMIDIRRGLSVARALGAVDVGQSVIVQGSIVLGVEAAEGTAELIKRCAALKRAGPAPILIKAAKPGQDRALDLPTIGPDTIAQIVAAGLRGIAVSAGSTLIADPVRVAEAADNAGVFVYGVDHVA